MTKMSKTAAQRLVKEALNGLESFQTALETIVETKAWTYLGYETFTELWNAKFAGKVRLGLNVEKALVAYAIISDFENTDEDVTSKVVEATGLGNNVVNSLRAQRDKGIAPNLIVLRGGSTGRTKGSPTVYRYVKIERAQAEEWKDIAEARELDFEEESFRILSEGWSKLGKQRVQRAS